MVGKTTSLTFHVSKAIMGFLILIVQKDFRLSNKIRKKREKLNAFREKTLLTFKSVLKRKFWAMTRHDYTSRQFVSVSSIISAKKMNHVRNSTHELVQVQDCSGLYKKTAIHMINCVGF